MQFVELFADVLFPDTFLIRDAVHILFFWIGMMLLPKYIALV
jgi:hypothetical protein